MHYNRHEHNIIVSYNCVLQCSSGIEASQRGMMEQSATVQGRGLYGLGWGALVAGLYCLPTLLDDEHSGDGGDGMIMVSLVVMMNRVVIRVARMSRLS